MRETHDMARVWFCRGLAFLGLLLFFLATAPVNRSEAEDAYEYAWCVETMTGMDLLDGHHLFYLPLMKALSSAERGAAFPVMVAVSAVSTAVLLLLFHSLVRTRLVFGAFDAMLATAAVTFSYGVWRYAAEAEIYGISGAMALLLLSVAVAKDGGIRRPVLAALIALAGVCIHVMNILPALALGVVCLLQRRWKEAVCFGTVFMASLMFLVLMLLHLGWDAGQMLQVSPLAYSGGMFRLASYPRALVGLGSGVVASQFVFGWEVVRHLAVECFPGMMLAEESFFGECIGMNVAWAGAVLAAACLLAFLWLVSRFPWRRKNVLGPSASKTLAVVAGIWCMLFMLVIFRYDPAAPEFWIQTVPPFFLLAFSLIAYRDGAVRMRIPMFVFVGLLFVHNGFVGMLPLKKGDADYNIVKARPLLNEVREGDLVLSCDNPVFFHYLRYVCPCEVIDLYAVDQDMESFFLQKIAGYPGAVYAFNDLGNPAPNMRLRMPDQWERARRLGVRLRNDPSIVIVE